MRASSSKLLLIAAFALSACNCAPKVVPDAGTPDAAVDVDAGFDAGVDEPDAGDEDAGPPPELKVTRLLPPRGASAGGTPVLIEGSGFLRDFAPSGTAASAAL